MDKSLGEFYLGVFFNPVCVILNATVNPVVYYFRIAGMKSQMAKTLKDMQQIPRSPAVWRRRRDYCLDDQWRRARICAEDSPRGVVEEMGSVTEVTRGECSVTRGECSVTRGGESEFSVVMGRGEFGAAAVLQKPNINTRTNNLNVVVASNL